MQYLKGGSKLRAVWRHTTFPFVPPSPYAPRSASLVKRVRQTGSCAGGSLHRGSAVPQAKAQRGIRSLPLHGPHAPPPQCLGCREAQKQAWHGTRWCGAGPRHGSVCTVHRLTREGGAGREAEGAPAPAVLNAAVASTAHPPPPHTQQRLPPPPRFQRLIAPWSQPL